jgi:hypothetical protein
MSLWANTARDFAGRPSSSRAISPKSVLMAGLPERLTIDSVVADAFTLIPHYIHALAIWQAGLPTVAELSGRDSREKGDRHHLCSAPGTDRRLVGPFRQMVPVPFFPRSRKVI